MEEVAAAAEAPAAEAPAVEEAAAVVEAPATEVEVPPADVVEDLQITSSDRPESAEEAAVAEVADAPRPGTEIEIERDGEEVTQ